MGDKYKIFGIGGFSILIYFTNLHENNNPQLKGFMFSNFSNVLSLLIYARVDWYFYLEYLIIEKKRLKYVFDS